jgi:hypothetical protein
LFLIDPAGNGDEQETEGVEGPGRRYSISLSYAARLSYWTLRAWGRRYSACVA